MIIQENALQHWIDHFYGYGSWHARIWFISHEESGGDLPEDVAERLNYFVHAHPERQATLCDVRSLFGSVTARMDGPRASKFDTLFDHRFGDNAIQHGGWKNLMTFTEGYQSKKFPDLLSYQKEQFVEPAAANEALINLYPLPAPHNHAWYYSWLDMPHFGFLKARGEYEEYLYTDRINTILQNLKTYKPQIVVMYGMKNIHALKKSVQQFFPEVTFKMNKVVKQLIPQHHRADVNGTTLLITTQVPTLRHNRVETGFDWNAFGKLVS